MSWLDGWLNQTVTWEVDLSDPEEPSRGWEEIPYDDPVTIAARKEERVIETTGPGGLERRQSNVVWVEEDVAVGDKIDGEIVQGRDVRRDMDGAIAYYELRTEP